MKTQAKCNVCGKVIADCTCEFRQPKPAKKPARKRIEK